MKKINKNSIQLEIFKGDLPKKGDETMKISEESVHKGKQIFLDNRQEIYQRILNRKME